MPQDEALPMINPITICFLIDKAREFHTKEGVVIPEPPLSPSDDDVGRMVLADHADDPTYEEFCAAVDDLEPDQQVAAVALMWLGRGDFTADQWDSGLEEARRDWTPRTADYLLSTPLVADYLAEGLSLLGYDCSE
ncbi:MAG: DUF3775 domain-containing protein [Gammaproteobacteria bacterium]|jgi:hypothetical protein|nr:DUF3775 domain-containing protein [Gammaproteobacteria bacterium]